MTFREEELLGRTMGPCRLESVLGRGGMGVVYRAQHLRLERPVAVKVLSGGGDARRLLQEARLAARLSDPRIVSIHDAGLEGEFPYIVMQLVSGETLEQRVRRGGPLKPEEALRAMKEVLLGLQAAHAAGVVHRDVKPANIMLESSGGVKIMDFGVSAERGGLPSEQAQDVAGSWDFMPPEQAYGAAPSAAMDLYSFGATFFYALTGAPPYGSGPAHEHMVRHRDAPVPDVRQRRPEVTARAAALLRRLLQKDPQARPASAEEVLAEMSSHGMLLEVDPSGSPFILLPPPVAPTEEGFVPPELAQEPERAVEAIESPPALLSRPKTPSRAPAYAACSVIAAAFLPLWRSVGSFDWLVAAATATLITARLIWSDRAALSRRLAGVAAWTGLVVFMGLYAQSVGLSWSLETGILVGLGLALGAGALSLGVLTAHDADQGAAAALLAASAAVLLAAASGAGQEGLAAARARLGQDARPFLSSAGPWRWGGLFLAWGAWRLLRPRSGPAIGRAAPPKIRNWNR